MTADPLRESSERVETLLERFDSFPQTTGTRADAEELVRVISALYGEALARIAQTLRDALGGQAPKLLERCSADPLVASLLVAHGLHPVPLDERVRRAIDGVRPYLRSHAGDVEVLRIDEDAVELRLTGTCDGCSSSQATLKLAIERAVFSAAPEVLEVRAVGVSDGPHLDTDGLLSVSRWSEVCAPANVPSHEVVSTRIDGANVLLMRDGPTWYAYRDRCPTCELALRSPTLAWPLLTCAGCGCQFDVLRAGWTQSGRALEPLPLTGEGERLRIAVPVAA